MTALKQLSPAYPTEDAFVRAYSRGMPAVRLVAHQRLRVALDGVSVIAEPGDILIGFAWGVLSW